MLERRVLMVCAVVGFLGLLSAALGFGAEATRIRSSQVSQDLNSACHYSRSPAFALGITAAVSLLIAQIIINVSTGCICCRRGPNPTGSNWGIALVCFVISWFSFALSFLLMLGGAALNDQHDDSMYWSDCYVVKSGVFALASVLDVVSIALGISYYLTIICAKEANEWRNGQTANDQGGVAMGQPQDPPLSQNPVFVHEDTYMRRQFT